MSDAAQYLIAIILFLFKVFFLPYIYIPCVMEAMPWASRRLIYFYARHLSSRFWRLVGASFIMTGLIVWLGGRLQAPTFKLSAWFGSWKLLVPFSENFNHALAICGINAVFDLLALHAIIRGMKKLSGDYTGSSAVIRVVSGMLLQSAALSVAAMFATHTYLSTPLFAPSSGGQSLMRTMLEIVVLWYYCIANPSVLPSITQYDITVFLLSLTTFLPLAIFFTVTFLFSLASCGALAFRAARSILGFSRPHPETADMHGGTPSIPNTEYSFVANQSGREPGWLGYMQAKMAESRKDAEKKASFAFTRFQRRMAWVLKGLKRSIALVLLVIVLSAAYSLLFLPDKHYLEAALNHMEVVVSKKGDTIEFIDSTQKLPVGYDALPKHVTWALTAMEDRRFFDHHGVDPRGLLRAAYQTLFNGGMQGGSTITQQLCKNLALSQERSYSRKIKEALLAVKMDLLYFDKKEILEAYLNQVCFGNHCYGIEAAARHYFGKRAKNLNLYESALLVGSLSAPNKLNIQDHPEAAKQRARLVLKKMVELGHISPDDAARAVRMGWQKGVRVLRDIEFRYFYDWIRRQIAEYIGDAEGDITVVTTIVPEAQVYAELAVARMLNHGKLKGCQGALLAMRPDGAVIAMVGGRDYADSQFNRTVQAKRQIGSLMKPLVYLASLEEGWTLENRLSDQPVKDGWPRNWDGVHKDSVTLFEALTTSRNAAAVRLSEKIGRKNVIALARRLGIESPLADQPSLALGVNECSMIEILECYSIFAKDGKKTEPFGILFIRDEKGKILYERSGENEKRLIKKQDAENLNKMLAGVMSPSGTGHRANFSGAKLFGKTGTTQDSRDAWFVGYSEKVVASVWVGRDDSTPMQGVSGGISPALVWREFMVRVHQFIDFESW